MTIYIAQLVLHSQLHYYYLLYIRVYYCNNKKTRKKSLSGSMFEIIEILIANGTTVFRIVVIVEIN